MQFQYRVRKRGFSKSNNVSMTFQQQLREPMKLQVDNHIKKELELHQQTFTEPIKKCVPKKRILVVKNAEHIYPTVPTDKSKIAVDLQVLEEMKSSMSSQLHLQLKQQKQKYEEQMTQMKEYETKKIKELEQFSLQQEHTRQEELRLFTKTQKFEFEKQREQWQQEQEKLRQQNEKVLEEKDNWLKKKEELFDQQKKLWIQEQENKFNLQKEKWLEEQENNYLHIKEPIGDYVKEDQLEPALEKIITQVMCCTIDNDESESRFEQLIGPTIERLVRKILDIEPEEDIQPVSEDCDDFGYGDVYDFEIDNKSLDYIREAIVKKSVVPEKPIINPLFNKIERSYATNSTKKNESPPVEMDIIYNDQGEQFFENEMRLKLNDKRRWSTYGSGVRKDAITSMCIDTLSGNIAICGLFNSVNLNECNNIAIYDRITKRWNNMKGGLNNMATCMVIFGEFIYVGGVFTKSNSNISLKHIARYHIKKQEWEPLGAGLDSECCTICMDHNTNKLYAGGTFTLSGSTKMSYLAVYDINSNKWEKMIGGNINAPCRCLFLDSEKKKLFVGGLFTKIENKDMNYIASYCLSTNKWESLSTGLQGYCNTIYVRDNQLYAGGTFTCVGNNIARYDLQEKTWSALSDGLNGICNAIVVNNNGHVFAGGSFTNENKNEILVNRIAIFNNEENAWLPLENMKDQSNTEDYLTGLDSVCRFLLLTENSVYMTGSFQKAGNIDAGCIARYKM